jgi:cytochrome c biogenesis protein
VNNIAGKGVAWRILLPLGSLRSLVGLLPLLAVAVLFTYHSDARMAWWLAIPLAACACNLLAAILTNGAFRRQLPLLVFHLALLVLILLLAAGRLTYLKGKAEVVEGGAFEGDLVEVETGP